MAHPIEIDPDRFLREHCALPALPEVVTRIQQIIVSDKADVNEVAELISSDTAILAQVLKIVNSAYYGLPTEITKVRLAVAFLGLHEIYRVVVSLAVVNSLAIKQKKELDQFWFHSFFTARCAKLMAKRYERLLSYEELWPAAMLHDVGKLVYLKFFPDHYKELKQYCYEQGVTFGQAEERLQYPESAYLGTLLCDHWRLPDQAKMGCQFHTLGHLLSAQGGNRPKPIQRVVCLANLVAVLAAEPLNKETKEEIVGALQTELGCNQDEFLTLMADIYQVKTEVESLASQFSL